MVTIRAVMHIGFQLDKRFHNSIPNNHIIRSQIHGPGSAVGKRPELRPSPERARYIAAKASR
jgi:hypothetical protein